MSRRSTFATARRVMQQLRRDRRTVAMLLLVPVVLMALMKGIFAGQSGAFQRVGVPLVGIFPLISMFIVTAVTMLRERTSGTLERLMTMPLAKIDVLAGYALAFGALAAAQAALATLVCVTLLGLHVAGPIWAVMLLAILNAEFGMALGLFVSAFARTEFQAVQFMPLFLMPQVFLSGLMAPRAAMPRALRVLSDYLPLSYAFEALRDVAIRSSLSLTVLRDASIVGVATVAALVLGAATLRRRTD